MELDEFDETISLTALPGAPVKQLTVFLENRVGALLPLVRMINELKVEVLGLSISDSVDVTIVRFVLTDPEAVGARFMERGIPFSETQILVVELKEGAHGLAGLLATLLEGETNVHFSYPLLSRPNGKATIAIFVDDYDFGATALQAAGYRLLFQEDLSR